MLTAELHAQVDLDNINFVSNDRLLARWSAPRRAGAGRRRRSASTTEARLRALKIGLLLVAALSLLAIFPASRLPSYKPGEIPSNPPLPKPQAKRDDE